MKHVILLAVILMSLLGGNSVHAAPIVCNPIDSNQVASYNGVNIDTLDANTRHCEFTGDVQKNKHSHPATTTQVNTVSTQDVPATSTHSVKNKHCNNGNGNGAEGCNASDKGNNDETPAKGDKDINHPTH